MRAAARGGGTAPAPCRAVPPVHSVLDMHACRSGLAGPGQQHLYLRVKTCARHMYRGEGTPMAILGRDSCDEDCFTISCPGPVAEKTSWVQLLKKQLGARAELYQRDPN